MNEQNRKTQRDPAQRDNTGAGQQTPNTDMQAEDTGTADSGDTGRGTAAEKAMKQTSKTDAERGSKS